MFLSELAQRGSRSYIVARFENNVVGYAGMMFTGEEAHVTNIAVDPDFHGRKVGTRLLYALVTEAIARGAERVSLEVRVSNEVAQAMYDKFGFSVVGTRKGYYIETNEDAFVMLVGERALHGIPADARIDPGRDQEPELVNEVQTAPSPTRPGAQDRGVGRRDARARHRDLVRRDLGVRGQRGPRDPLERHRVADRAARRVRGHRSRDRGSRPRRGADADDPRGAAASRRHLLGPRRDRGDSGSRADRVACSSASPKRSRSRPSWTSRRSG